ncbi:molybdenum cofactor biosynthesis protein MoaE [Asticcacaulis sp.]|uniref:molybdenum cofactor biosynthesis protein MoaE n=1 Tax=Asticcacaulis sp. TaxID=1872648 RepID=UPI002C23E0EA|nr:molybdenum cofactor biosynthesis protein MoaE [Asticcacaulis sp.]HTM82867.1 molybdenum cofactor biosynthesis protein MoaE [Asticcacaulis sp.]
MSRPHVVLSPEALDIARVQAEFVIEFGHLGALSTFTGIVRPRYNDHIVEYLELDWYPGMSERSIKEVAAEAARRFSLEALTIIHRCGKVLAGEPIVFVGAAAAHRRGTIKAVDYTLDRLKSDIALWKREVGPKLDHWVEPTNKDATDLRRWA